MTRPYSAVLRIRADQDLRSTLRAFQRQLEAEIGQVEADAAAAVIATSAMDLQRELQTTHKRNQRLERTLAGQGWTLRLTSHPPTWFERVRAAWGVEKW